MMTMTMTILAGAHSIAAKSKSPKRVSVREILIELPDGAKLSLPAPKLSPLSGQANEAFKLNRSFRLGPEYVELLEWNGLSLQSKLVELNRSTPIATVLKEETLFEVPASAVKTETFAWGTVSSYCTPSSGSTCAFLMRINRLKAKTEEQEATLFLRYSASASLTFDFSKVKLK
jgi:hypothetical protein